MLHFLILQTQNNINFYNELSRMKSLETLALISGKVEKEILIRNEYLAVENEILKSKLNGVIKFKDAERIRLAKISK